MPVGDFFSQYGANEFSGFASPYDKVGGKGGDITLLSEREGTEAFADFLKREFESGSLSDASVNPAITGYLNSIGRNERRRQDELLSYLGNTGMNEAQVRAIIAEDDVRGQRELSSALAGFQDQLQSERYRAKSGLVSYAAEESAAERAAAYDHYWRTKYRSDAKKENKKARQWAAITSGAQPLGGVAPAVIGSATTAGINSSNNQNALAIQQAQNDAQQQQLNTLLPYLQGGGGGSFGSGQAVSGSSGSGGGGLIGTLLGLFSGGAGGALAGSALGSQGGQGQSLSQTQFSSGPY